MNQKLGKLLIKPRILIMAGGTGGHVFPALAVARHLQDKGWEIHWLGTKEGLEAEIIPKAAIPIHSIDIKGLRRKGKLAWILAPIQLILALFQSLRVISRLRPKVVLGMGGFVSGPGGIAAWLMRCPLVIHEQNSIVGMTNRWLAHIAKQVLEAFPGAFKSTMGAKCIGNPVRKELLTLPVPKERFKNRMGRDSGVDSAGVTGLGLSGSGSSGSGSSGSGSSGSGSSGSGSSGSGSSGSGSSGSGSETLRLLILGGSRGAQALNQICPSALQTLPHDKRPDVWHQTGGGQDSVTRELYQNAGVSARIDPFIQDMAEAYAWADLVVCRAGALTVAELTAVGIGSILVPYPFAVDDHQTHNGRFLETAGAAKLIAQSDLDKDRLAALILELSADRDQLLKMAETARTLAYNDAAIAAATYCIEAGGKAL